MIVRAALVDGLLVLGLLSIALSALGLLVTRDLLKQIQYTYPASLVGAIAIPAAICLQEGWNQAGAKSIAIALLLVWTNPVLSHAIARSGRIRRQRQWPPLPDEKIAQAEKEKQP